ncbi:nucleotide disphospho-sugar-binding domain-containing protein [Streptomyces sp. NPDC000345]|uniref:nucleotide disphospho-sugar-binding domain-containing protein n=1 Tax=Streptomyces sp. NPDC000345 TaxID=3364537 RepID=UPI00369EAFA3
MRILLTTAPLPSHLFHLVPLAWALRAAGHEVLVAAQEEFAAQVTAAGLPAAPLAPGAALPDMIGRDRAGRPVPWVAGPEEKARRSGHGFGRLAAHALPATAALVRAWRPALIVSEPSEFAGGLVAAQEGVPWAELDWGPVVLPAFTAGAHDELTPERARRGLAAMPEPHLRLDVCPPGIRGTTAPRARSRPMRFVPYNGSATAPDWLGEQSALPRICVTLGSFAAAASHRALLDAVLAGLAGLDAEILVTAETADGCPPGVRPVGRLPLDLLLPHCALVVHHGGIGSLLTALHHGVPQLCLPLAGHDAQHADRLAALGAGRGLDPAEATAQAVRAHAVPLLTDPRHRAAAARASRDLARLPGPDRLVTVLEELAG